MLLSSKSISPYYPVIRKACVWRRYAPISSMANQLGCPKTSLNFLVVPRQFPIITSNIINLLFFLATSIGRGPGRELQPLSDEFWMRIVVKSLPILAVNPVYLSMHRVIYMSFYGGITRREARFPRRGKGSSFLKSATLPV
jgi:hypothetical protein